MYSEWIHIETTPWIPHWTIIPLHQQMATVHNALTELDYCIPQKGKTQTVNTHTCYIQLNQLQKTDYYIIMKFSANRIYLYVFTITCKIQIVIMPNTALLFYVSIKYHINITNVLFCHYINCIMLSWYHQCLTVILHFTTFSMLIVVI